MSVTRLQEVKRIHCTDFANFCRCTHPLSRYIFFCIAVGSGAGKVLKSVGQGAGQAFGGSKCK